jgi:nucleoside-diphosphate-sugar epimerase
VDLVEEIFSVLGKQPVVKQDPERLRPEKSEVRRLLSDNNLARGQLGWTPRIGLRNGLSNTIEWISNNLDFYRSQQYQI